MTTNHITQAMANPEIIAELGRRFKEYRLTYRFTQKEAAEKAGVSLITLRQFENGKAYNINMGNFLALLRSSGLSGTDGRPAAGNTCFSLYYGTNNE
ncbi:MAG: helix-turn-helix domain-containing protein [Parabacteroides merdae]